jgi:GAF domain-containing protein/HAMP domain-containing protein
VNPSSLVQVLQMAAWTLGLAEAILGLYVLVFNIWNPTNRQLGAFFLFLSLHNFALGFWLRSETVFEAWLPMIVLAFTLPAIQPLVLWMAVRLARSQWMEQEGRIFRWLALCLMLFPWILTVSDLLLGTRFWFTGLQAGLTAQAKLAPSVMPFTMGRLAYLVRGLDYFLAPMTTMGVLGYLLWKERKAHPETRRITWWLLAGQALCLAVFLRARAYFPSTILLCGAVTFFIFGFAGFKKMSAERHLLRGNLQTRLTLLTLAVSLPVLGAITFFAVEQARGQVSTYATQALERNASSMATTLELWMAHNEQALETLVARPEVTGMDPLAQSQVLQQASEAYPELDWIGTVDLEGQVLAHSGNGDFDFSGQKAFFQKGLSEDAQAFETLSGTNDGNTYLATGAPIRDESGRPAGTSIFIIDVKKLFSMLRLEQMAGDQTAYLVDAQDEPVLGANMNAIAELPGLGNYMPVKALREGRHGLVEFVDASGRKWQAQVERLANDWGVIVQMPEASMAPLGNFLKAAAFGLAVGAMLLFVTIWFSMRQGLEPIRRLTETATLISTGDLTRIVSETSQDEIGLLAHAFNTMTDRLREMIARLERRVTERTEDLERKALQLQVTADVAREAAAIHDLEYLLQHVVHVISERFDFYHAGVFLLDEERQFAVLRAASSQGGRQMLARGHKLEVGRVGIVGHVAAEGEPRIALDVGTDAVYFDNPDLPRTRSEVGLPLVSRGEIIGVLDVQSTQPSAFSKEDLEILQLLADQVALAIDNARLLRDSQQALEELEVLYSQQVRQAWEKRLDEKRLSFNYQPPGEISKGENGKQALSGKQGRLLEVPILLRGVQLGIVTLRRAPEQGEWLPEEQQLAEEAVKQMALSIENARLLEEVQRRAYQERIVGEIAAQAQGSLNLNSVMKTTVEEIGKRLGAAKVRIRLNREVMEGERR